MATRFIQFRGLNTSEDRHPSQIDFEVAQDVVNFEFAGGVMTVSSGPIPTEGANHRIGASAQWSRWLADIGSGSSPTHPSAPDSPFPNSSAFLQFYRQRRFVASGATEDTTEDEWAVVEHNFPDNGIPTALWQLNGNLYYSDMTHIGRVFGNTEPSFSGDVIAEFGLVANF